MKPLFWCFILLISFSCKNEEDQKKNNPKRKLGVLDDEKTSFQDKVGYILDKRLINETKLNEFQIDNVKEFYTRLGYQSVFNNNNSKTILGKQLDIAVKNPLQYGLCESRLISLSGKSHWIENEVIDVINFTTILGDLKNGFIDFDSSELKTTHLVQLNVTMMDSIKNNDSTGLSDYFLQLGPLDTNYRYLANNIFDYYQKYPMDTSSWIIRSKKDDPENHLSNLKLKLSTKGYLLDTTQKAMNSALLKFKKDCGFEKSTIVTKAVLDALSESTNSKMIRAAITLDKLRQQKKKEKKHVRVNLPSFKLYFIAKNKLQSEHRVVIGKFKTQTPEFKAKINKIVAYPYWKVPHSISDKEILPAVRRKKSYLADHHYRIYRNEEEIDPDSVDFSKYYKRFPFTTIQDPGKHNSLGILKLVFYNEHGVYVHDTPAKSLFRRDFRSFSHGCVRCEKPIDLAKKILEFDEISSRNRNEITEDSLDLFISNEEHREIKLKRRIPIYIEYNSVTSDKKQLYFHNDLYVREQKLIELFLSK